MKFYTFSMYDYSGRALYKFLLVMKLILFFLTCAILQVSANTYAQKITLNKSNTPIIQIIKEIRQQSGYDFFYNKKIISLAKLVSVDLKNASLEEALTKIFENQPLTYTVTIAERAVVLKEKEEDQLSIPSFQHEVSGRVSDENGISLGGVSVRVKGTNIGASTNADGYFKIGLPSSDVFLVFSYLGYESIERKVGSATTISVVLLPREDKLNEVVVVGYGTQKKENLTGSVSSVKGEALENRPISNAVTGLQGLLSGVEIVSSSGQPGRNQESIRIRGVNTLNSDNSPLILIDGVQGDLSMMNPADIESVSVLKDAASSAIYGARAAAGVLLVTTKKGKFNAKSAVSYSGYVGIQSPSILPELVNGRQYMELYNEALANAGLATLFRDSAFIKYDRGLDANNYSNTNWIDEVYKPSATQQNHMMSINGGGTASGYHLSYAYLSQDGLVVADPFSSNRHNLRLRVNTELLDRIKVDGNLSYSNYFRQDAAAGGTAGVFRLSQRISPLLPVKWYKYDQNGGKSPTDVWSYGAVNNPINVASNSGYRQARSKIPIANMSATVNILKGLDLFTQYAFRETAELSKIYNTPVYRYGIDGSEFPGNASIKNSITSGSSNEVYQNFTSTLGYERNIGKHSLKFLSGYAQEWLNGSTVSGFRTKIIDGTEVLNNGTEEFSNNGTENHWALRSYFGRLNYNYQEKYLFEANLRKDGTSRFSVDNRWGVFPSFSVGWSLNKEKFMDFASSLFQQIKFRVSFGTLGNQNVGEFHPYLTPIKSYLRAYPIGLANNVAYYQSSIGNGNIHWETVEASNAGLDVMIFNNRLSITAEWFVKNNKDALLKPAYPAIIGLTNAAALPYANVGKVQSKGWELAASWKDKVGQFGYGLDAMLSDVKNTVKSLGGNDPTLGDNIFRVGDPLYAYYGYQTDGLAKVSDFQYYNETLKRYTGPNFATINSYTAITQPGDVKYRDISGPQGVPDGQINNLDKVVIGNPYPRFSYSLRGNLNWKDIDVSFFLQGIQKVDGYLYDEAIHAFINDYSIPQKVHLDRWTPTNPNATYPRLYYSQTHNREFSDYWIQNASYLRIKNIQLGYTLPKNILSKINIERMKFYVSLENPFTFTDYFYAFDPEIRSTSGDSYPQVKTISFGVNFMLR